MSSTHRKILLMFYTFDTSASDVPSRKEGAAVPGSGSAAGSTHRVRTSPVCRACSSAGAAASSNFPTLVSRVAFPWRRSILLTIAVTGSESAPSSACAHGPSAPLEGRDCCARTGRVRITPRRTVIHRVKIFLISVPPFFSAGKHLFAFLTRNHHARRREAKKRTQSVSFSPLRRQVYEAPHPPGS